MKLVRRDCDCHWPNLPLKPLSLRSNLWTASEISVADSWDELVGDDCPEGMEKSGEVEFEVGIESEAGATELIEREAGKGENAMVEA